MKIYLDNYRLSCYEILFSAATLTGGALVKRHWSKSSEEISIYSKWGHRIVAVIEAIPLLGGLAALIEIVAVNILCKISSPTSCAGGVPRKEVPSFVQFQFERPWENIYLPLFNQLIGLGAIGSGIDWTKGMLKFLNTHDIWFEDGCFHVAKQTKEPKDDIRTFYALLSLAYGCQNEYLKMKSIHQLLIRPFLSRVPAQVIQATYWPFQMAIFRKANAGRSRLFDDICSHTPLEKAAIKIQRAFRRHTSQKICYSPRLAPYSFSLNLNPPTPLTSNAIIKEKAEDWINAHEGNLRTTARKFIQNIRHISFKRFINRLNVAVKSFNHYLMGLPEGQRKFVIVIPQDKIHSSNKWVTDLALPFFKKPPEDVILSDQFAGFKSRYPEVKRLVLLDDAAYSGKQLRNVLSSLPRGDHQFHAIVPYITSTGLSRIADVNVWISDHVKMLSVGDLCKIGAFTQEEEKLLEDATGDYDHGDLHCRSLTYFDHKIADYLSTYDNILNWGRLLAGRGSSIPFVSLTIPPYKSSKR